MHLSSLCQFICLPRRHTSLVILVIRFYLLIHVFFSRIKQLKSSFVNLWTKCQDLCSVNNNTSTATCKKTSTQLFNIQQLTVVFFFYTHKQKRLPTKRVPILNLVLLYAHEFPTLFLLLLFFVCLLFPQTKGNKRTGDENMSVLTIISGEYIHSYIQLNFRHSEQNSFDLFIN